MAVRHFVCFSSARISVGRGQAQRVSTAPRLCVPRAQSKRYRAMGEMAPLTAHHAQLSPPWGAHKASRAPSGRLWR